MSRPTHAGSDDGAILPAGAGRYTRAMHPRFCVEKTFARAALAAVLALGSACMHTTTIRVENDERAQIFVDGRPLGPAPAKHVEWFGAKDSVVDVKAKLKDGTVLEEKFQRDQVSWGAVGAAAAGGLGVCAGLMVCGSVAASVAGGCGAAPCVACGGVAAGCGAGVAGPIVGYSFLGVGRDEVVLSRSRRRAGRPSSSSNSSSSNAERPPQPMMPPPPLLEPIEPQAPTPPTSSTPATPSRGPADDEDNDVDERGPGNAPRGLAY